MKPPPGAAAPATPVLSDSQGGASGPAILATPGDAAAWERFVESRPDAANYHRWGWKQVIEQSFAWPTYYFWVRDHGQVTGILPLAFQKSPIFGSFLTSLPFFNYGGVLAATPSAEQTLVQAAVELAKSLGVGFLELRHRHQHPAVQLPANTHKVTLVRDIQPTEDLLWKSIDKKVRSDIRKSMSYKLTAEVRQDSGAIADFYPIFASNMRDLGTPVYDRRFFENILSAFPNDTFITIVRREATAIASSFLCGFRDTLEVPWSASLRQHLALKPNMLLYWKNLCVASENGYRRFDFGRSWRESGTHRFKLQWEPVEAPLYWHYWTPTGEAPSVNVRNPKFRVAIAAWQRLPLAITNRIGPCIARCLP